MQKMRRFTFLSVAIVLFVAALAVSCGRSVGSEAGADDVLVSVGDSMLRKGDVEKLIPRGLDSADSAAMARSIASDWVRTLLLADVARANSLDIDRIDRMTADYRNRLIMLEYTALMHDSRVAAPSARDVARYYELHADELLIDRPLVKGVYLKIASDAERLSDVRAWVKHPTAQAVDRLEKYGLRNAMHYDDFRDRWVDWTLLVDQIPYAFGDADEFVETNKDFEISDGASTFMLHITDYLPTGSRMPLEVAQAPIAEKIEAERRDEYDRRLIASLARKAYDEGRLRPGLFTPEELKQNKN